MNTIPQLATQMHTVLTTIADQAAVSSGYLVRPAKKLSGSVFVRLLVFSWLIDPSASVEDLSAFALIFGVLVSGPAVQQRFHDRAATMLQTVFAAALRQLVSATAPTQVFAQFNGIYLRDSTVISLPAALAEVWPGCGGSTAESAASGLKVQVCLELQSGALSGELQAAKAHDATATLPDLPAGSLHVGDLGYFSLKLFAQLAEQDCRFLSRYKVGTRLFTTEGADLDLVAALGEQAGDSVEMNVLVGGQQRLPLRLLAVRLTDEGALARRRRKLHEWERKQGRKAGAPLYALLGWTIYLTNATPTELSLAQAVVIYRSRWQVELLFKRWKSEGRVDEWRSAKPARIMCEVYAKLLAMMVKHWTVLVSCWTQPQRSLSKAGKLVSKAGLLLARASATVSDLQAALEFIATLLSHAPTVNKRVHNPSHGQLLAQCSRTTLSGELT